MQHILTSTLEIFLNMYNMLTYENCLPITFITIIILLVGSKSLTKVFSIAEEKIVVQEL